MSPLVWALGFLLAAVLGVVNFAVFMAADEPGYSLVVGVPLSMGALLGCLIRSRRWFLIAYRIVLVVTVIIPLMTFDMTGVTCRASIPGPRATAAISSARNSAQPGRSFHTRPT